MNHIQLLGSCCWSRCGYCEGDRRRNGRPVDASSPHSAIYAVSELSAEAYTHLLHAGWRRSGRVVYLPDNTQACCPQHTLRLPVAKFRPSKEQAKLQRRLASLMQREPSRTSSKGQNTLTKQQRFDRIYAWLRSSRLLEELQLEIQQKLTARLSQASSNDRTLVSAHSSSAPPSIKVHRCDDASVTLRCNLRGRAPKETLVQMGTTTSGTLYLQRPIPSDLFTNISTSSSVSGAGTSSISSEKLQKWWNRRKLSGKEKSPPVPALSVRTLTALESAVDPRVHQLYWDYQTQVHREPNPLRKRKDPDGNEDSATGAHQPNNERATASPVTHLVDDLHPKARTLLQKTYGDSPSVEIVTALSKFWEFLVDSPLMLDDRHSTATYHQQYWLGPDTLVAVSVLDILTDGVSSVYCFYDPSFPFPLGKLSCLYEISNYTRDTLRLPHYYMGYYIESCPKMQYKGSYRPSLIRSSVTGRWVDLDTVAQPLLRENDLCIDWGTTSTTTMGDDNHSRSSSLPLSSVPLAIQGSSCSYAHLPNEAQEQLRPHLERWIADAGPQAAEKCVLTFEGGGAEDESSDT